MDKCREEFETKFGVVGTRMPNGNYSSWAHQAKWDAFQAAWQLQQSKVDAALKCADLNFWNANTVDAIVNKLKGNS